MCAFHKAQGCRKTDGKGLPVTIRETVTSNRSVVKAIYLLDHAAKNVIKYTCIVGDVNKFTCANSIRIYTYLQICMHVYFTNMYMIIKTHINIYAHTHIRIHTYTHTRARTHTYANALIYT